ncbi:hypothetical protein [Roseibium sp. RKSG952]|uniref:hypothetical protein n=1 Tax=Roseibium sp. RKSG952 TaxID=2529384 RepID=UPI0012BD1AC2|nr:hypothetical protein [Roseibium sp. RKSG952]MTH97574.1 hypothetical protein [Roseibium sp. RKSG952]
MQDTSLPDLRVGFSDVVRSLLCLTGPDRGLDVVVHAMLGGGKFKPVVGPEDLRHHMWLFDQIPRYTADASAVSVLAYRHGFQVTLDALPDGSHQAVMSDPETGVSKSLTGRHSAGVALVSLIAALRSRMTLVTPVVAA